MPIRPGEHEFLKIHAWHTVLSTLITPELRHDTAHGQDACQISNTLQSISVLFPVSLLSGADYFGPRSKVFTPSYKDLSAALRLKLWIMDNAGSIDTRDPPTCHAYLPAKGNGCLFYFFLFRSKPRVNVNIPQGKNGKFPAPSPSLAFINILILSIHIQTGPAQLLLKFYPRVRHILFSVSS